MTTPAGRWKPGSVMPRLRVVVRKQGMSDETDAWRIDTCGHLHQAVHMASVLANGVRDGEGTAADHDSAHNVPVPEMYRSIQASFSRAAISPRPIHACMCAQLAHAGSSPNTRTPHTQ